MRPDFERDVRCVLGLPFDVLTEEQTEARVRRAIATRTRCVLATPNLNFVVGCLRTPTFRDAVLRSDLSVADGWPVVAVARLLGIPIPERVAGSSLFERIRRDGTPTTSVYFFGGPPGAADAACRRLNAEGGGATCVGAFAPGFGTVEEMSSEEVIDGINAAKPDFLVVALGAMKGHAWIDRNAGRLDVPVISHLGAVVNFTAGTVARAPRWMQRVGLEWLWRIRQEPALWRRYASDAIALLGLMVTRVVPAVIHARTRSRTRDSQAPQVTIRIEDDGAVVRLGGTLTSSNLSPARAAFQSEDVLSRPLALDLSGVEHLDSAAIGLLLLVHGARLHSGRDWRVRAVSPVARRLLRWSCADFLLEPLDRTSHDTALHRATPPV